MHKTQHCLICFLQLALCLLHNKAPLYDKPYDIKDNVNEVNNISVIIFNPTKLLRRYFQEPPPKDFLMLVVVAVLPHQRFLIFIICFLTFLDFSLYCKNYNLGGVFYLKRVLPYILLSYFVAFVTQMRAVAPNLGSSYPSSIYCFWLTHGLELWYSSCMNPYYPTSVLVSDNPGQNISKKIEKSSKMGQDKKGWYLLLLFFFNCYSQSLISRRETGH